MAQRPRSNIFDHFKKSLSNTSTVIADTLNIIDNKIQLYTPGSKGVPSILRPVRDSMEIILDYINVSITKMDFLDDTKSYYYVDVRGTWRMMLEIVERICGELRVTLMKLPGIQVPEPIYNKLIRRILQLSILPILRGLNEDCDIISKVFVLFIQVTFQPEDVDQDQCIEMISSLYVYPFWYRFNRYLARFRDMFEILKSSMVHSYGHSNFLVRKCALSLRSFEAMVTDNKVFAKKTSNECAKMASPEFVKRMWNLAESGLPQLFLSFMKPWIKTSIYFRLPIPDNMKSHLIFKRLRSVRILIISSQHLPFTIPSEWTMSAENMRPEELSEDKDILENTRIQTTRTNFFENLENEVDQLNGKIKDQHMVDSKFEGEGMTSEDSKNANNNQFVSDVSVEGCEDSTTPEKGDSDDMLDVVLHFHGGGFISGSPATHECYLREWASMTDYVILSVDYSLAPESAYPTQFHQCYFVYNWLVSSNNSFGIKIRKIILVGDSAGGTLALSVIYKAIEDGLRIPDGLLLAYPATDLTKTITPSRILFANDVLLPHYFLQVCLDSYVKPGVDATNHLVSPLYAPTQVLEKLPNNIVILAAGFDPLLDDSLRFLYELDRIKKNYIFEVYNCPHGFLNMGPLIPAAKYAIKRAGKFLKCMADKDYTKKFYEKELNRKKKMHQKRLNGMHMRLTLPLDLLNTQNENIDNKVSPVLSKYPKPTDYKGEIEDIKLVLRPLYDDEDQYEVVRSNLDSICDNRKKMEQIVDENDEKDDNDEINSKLGPLYRANAELFEKIKRNLQHHCKKNQKQLDFLQSKLQILMIKSNDISKTPK